jgi:type II secretory pathway component GspD/PulD (secretin)
MRFLLACVLFAPVGAVPFANASPGTGRSTPIAANYTDESLAKALASMGEMAGVKILFDADFRDRTLTIRFDGETFDVALAQVLRTNRLFAKFLGERTLVVVPDIQIKHRIYDRWVATKPFLFVPNRSPITLSFTDASLKSVFEALGNAAGVKVLFDPDFRDQLVSIRFEEEALEPALDQLILPRRLFLAVIEGDAIVIAPDSLELRQKYEKGPPPAGS